MNNPHEESTYSMLVRSEEKGRGLLEAVLYAFFILSAMAAIVQFAHQPVKVPASGYAPGSALEASASTI